MSLKTSLLPPENPKRTRARLWRRRLQLEAAIPKSKKEEFKEDRMLDGWKVTLGGMFLRMLGLYAPGVRNATTPVLRELTFDFTELPDNFDGFRILHLSDFHFRDKPEFTETICSLVRGIHADLCVMTGDFRYSNGAPLRPVYESLEPIVQCVHIAGDFLAILGNNDTGRLVETLSPLGIRVLVNENTPIRRGEHAIWIAGVDDPHDYACDSLRDAAAGIPNGAFTILLAHSPEIADMAAACGIDLYLCGHTHGGQIRFPRVGSIYRNARCPFRLMQGTWQLGRMHGFTTTGLGTSTLPVRFNCPPEAAVVTLTKAK